jgi:hypothetical protein
VTENAAASAATLPAEPIATLGLLASYPRGSRELIENERMLAMMTRAQFLRGLFALPVILPAAGLAQASQVTQSEPPKAGAVVRMARVPFDHYRPAEGTFELEYLLAGPFQPGNPTVMVLADGQQFYVRQDLWAGWHDRFGPAINVVGIAGRATAPDLQKRVGIPRGDEWIEAYRLLRYEQWIADADVVRRQLVGPEGKVMLYGASGGARLVHEYLSRFGHHASHVFTRASVFTYLDAEFGLRSDRFWDEISVEERALLTDLLGRTEQREEIAKLFQRQNFFVPAERIGQARHQLVLDLAADRKEVIAKLRDEYQINAIEQLQASPLGPAIIVRLYEFFAPIAHHFVPRSAVLRPDLEVSELTSRPLMDLNRAGRIPPPKVDLAALHKVQADTVMLAGRYDHTADYRTQIALASHYPRRRLVILDDNHNFAKLGEMEGMNRALLEGARHGIDSPQFAATLQALDPLIWRDS